MTIGCLFRQAPRRARDARDDDGHAIAAGWPWRSICSPTRSRWSVSTASTARAPGMPGRPTMDIALVLEQIGDAKELVQSVIEAERA